MYDLDEQECFVEIINVIVFKISKRRYLKRYVFKHRACRKLNLPDLSTVTMNHISSPHLKSILSTFTVS